jgi:hypothetical protein
MMALKPIHLSHRAHLRVSNAEKLWKSILESSLACPFVHPELSAPSITDLKLGPKFEKVLDLVEATPELGTPLSRSLKDVVGGVVFCSDDLSPDRVISLVQLPNPLEHQSQIHFFGVKEPSPPHSLGLQTAGQLTR